ncbi:MAG: galactose-1-phosphate uridylyltransferase [Candidatus Bipolaricaulota bacterium]|nr:MAG: galactose-1-phosphate uridylyltransferase [Candidatus Bipolaricaulota bacterium]
MPELRRGPTNDRWVIVAPERAKRPSDFAKRGSELDEQQPEGCPFCAGNEEMTPAETFRVANGKEWYVRVVPNKFAALQDYDDLGREAIEGFYDRMNGVGAHEVVVETPEHFCEIPDLPAEQIKRIIDAYIARLRELMTNPWFRYVILFRNHGKEAGASLLHPHSQIIATPVVPQEVRNSLNIARAYYESKERCLFCDVMLAEIRGGHRVVEENDGYVAWAPYASRFPFEFVIYPKAHSHDFTTLDDDQRLDLAWILKRSLQRLTLLLGDIPYNFVLKTTPNPVPRPGKPGYWKTLPYDYHWRIAVLPRLTRVAGFEWGTGFYINPMPPEDAARHLREVDLADA